jgi:glycosyltransferase involved in cell wall biosynthesis
MRIGIDISQIIYEGTGVGRYVRELVSTLIRLFPEHEYVLFGSSLRKRNILFKFTEQMKNISPNVKAVLWLIPPTILDILWNKFHILPVTWLIGSIDVFWSSDWTQPPLAKAKGVTTIHDLSFLRYPESFHKKIIEVQNRRLNRAKKECSRFFCDSEATKNDVIDYCHISADKCIVVYPGIYGE